jgi:hypothetical protein
LLAVAEACNWFEHFAFEALHVFERDVEEVAEPQAGSSTRRLAQAVVEGATSATRGFRACLRWRAAGRRPGRCASLARSGSMTVGRTRRST